MGKDQLQRLGRGDFKYDNPYVKKTDAGSDAILNAGKKEREVAKPTELSILAQNGHLMGRMIALENELKNLKFDVLTLLSIIEEENGQMTMKAAREKLFSFRASQGHLMNRIVDKTQVIIDQDFKI